MPDAKVSSTNQAKLKLRPADLWQMGTLVAYGILMCATLLAAVLLKRSGSEISTGVIVWLMGGWGLFLQAHIGQQFRIAKLEQQLAESELSRRS